MKHIFKSILFISAMLSISACKSHKMQATDTVEDFANAFEKTVLTHKTEDVLKFMTNVYVKEQHDEFLAGRTKQFLNEFFCGNTEMKPSNFKCIDDYSQINAITRVSISPTNYGYKYVFKIQFKKEWIVVEQSIDKSPSKQNAHMGLLGASG